MSHVTDVKLRIKDIDALKEAAQACGLEFRENQTHYAWWGNYVGDSRNYGKHDPSKFGQCEHALREPGTTPKDGSAGPWEIGVVKAAGGEEGFDLLYDEYGSAGQRLTARVGQGANKLRREYAAAVATRKASSKFRVQREDLPGGRIRLKLRKR